MANLDHKTLRNDSRTFYCENHSQTGSPGKILCLLNFIENYRNAKVFAG